MTTPPADDRLDLEPLAAGAIVVDRVVGRVLEEARASNERVPVLHHVARLRWGALAAAAGIALVTALGGSGSGAAAPEIPSPSVALAAGLPGSWVGWIVTEELPSAGELLLRYGSP